MRTKTFVAASGGWILLIVWAAYEAIAPAWFWIDYRQLMVSDGVAGGAPPQVTQDIVFDKLLLVRWDRTLFFRDGDDYWTPICYSEGAASRYPGFANLTAPLDAFFDGRACAKRLPPGEYFVEEDVEWNDLVARNAGAESNTFEITEPEPAPRSRAAPLAPAAPAPVKQRHSRIRPKQRAPWPLSIFIH